MKKTAFNKRESRKQLVLLAVLLILVMGGITSYVGYRNHGASEQVTVTKKPPSNKLHLPSSSSQLSFIRVEPLVAVPLPLSEPLNARLALAEDLTARVFAPIAGRVLELKASAGDPVKAGQPLAILDAPDFGQFVTDVQKAEVDASQKNKALNRATLLYEGEAIAKKDLESAEADFRSAQAELVRARLRLQNLTAGGQRIEGERMHLRAPLSGVVVDRQANPGTEVRPDAAVPLFVVSDLKRLWIYVDLPERLSPRVKVGDVIQFSTDAFPDRQMSATVDRIAAVVDPTTRRITVKATVQNTALELKPDMFALTYIVDQSDQRVLRIPTGAVLTQGLKSQVFVKTGPEDFERREVGLLRQDARYAYLKVDSNLKAGDQIVVKGALLLASEMAQGE